MKRDIRAAVQTAAEVTQTAVPLDWKRNPCPEWWQTQKGEQEFPWYQVPREYYESEFL